jgi:hypothetical protein
LLSSYSVVKYVSSPFVLRLGCLWVLTAPGFSFLSDPDPGLALALYLGLTPTLTLAYSTPALRLLRRLFTNTPLMGSGFLSTTRCCGCWTCRLYGCWMDGRAHRRTHRRTHRGMHRCTDGRTDTDARTDAHTDAQQCA